MLEEIWNITITIDNEKTRTIIPRAMLGPPAQCFNEYTYRWFMAERIILRTWTSFLGPVSGGMKRRWFIRELDNK